MRYFKYKNTRITEKLAKREHYKSLSINEKSIYRKYKFWLYFGGIVCMSVFAVCFLGSLLLIEIISEQSGLIFVLIKIGKFILRLVSFIISLFVAVMIAYPIVSIANRYDIPSVKKDILSKSCSHFRKYYGLGEPYIITKCYDSTDKRFINHDICIFVKYGELRITADIVHGFLYGSGDLGCYAFNPENISLSAKQTDRLMITDLKSEKVEFALGKIANSFIRQNFTDN